MLTSARNNNKIHYHPILEEMVPGGASKRR